MMYIINVIPLVKIPYPNSQILSYFFKEKLPKGALVQISLRKKQTNAIVFSSENLEKKKIDIKKGTSFKLKPIEKVISKNPVLTKNQFKLLFWFSEYYFSPLGLVTKLFVPRESYQMPIINKQTLKLTPETKKNVFFPFKNLKSIIIENADSPKYVSWGRQPYYNIQKVALQLAKIFKAKIVLKSTHPSVETYYWAQKNKYRLQIQDTRYPGRAPRSGTGKIQNTKLVDMRKEIKKGNYSILSDELQKELKKARKSILYISRRGTATFILCRDCGHVLKCPYCDVPLVYHENTKYKIQDTKYYLLCHHCGNEEKPLTLCPNCKGYRIKYFGAGTQRVEMEIKNILPKTKVFRLDSDRAKTPAEQWKIIDKFNGFKNLPRGKAGAILIGTQMLFEKDIRPINLIGVVSIETILNLPDYRSSERVFKILNQLRSMSKKKFLIQTYNPKNSAIINAVDNNWKKFYNEEIKIRKVLSYPPFSQIIKLSFEHKDPKKTEDEAKILLEKLKQQIKNLKFEVNSLELLGPVPAFIPKIREKHRWNIVIKSKNPALLAGRQEPRIRNQLLMIVPPNWKIEVDPENLL